MWLSTLLHPVFTPASHPSDPSSERHCCADERWQRLRIANNQILNVFEEFVLESYSVLYQLKGVFCTLSSPMWANAVFLWWDKRQCFSPGL